jgi:hypothetical protein
VSRRTADCHLVSRRLGLSGRLGTLIGRHGIWRNAIVALSPTLKAKMMKPLTVACITLFGVVAC